MPAPTVPEEPGGLACGVHGGSATKSPAGDEQRPARQTERGSIDEIVIQPDGASWSKLRETASDWTLQDAGRAAWQARVRRELGLPVDRAIIVTGHQTLLWHPGILAKYLAADAAAGSMGAARANVVVDQHVGGFGSFAAPTRQPGGRLAMATITLARERPEVPMARHEPFVPPSPPPLPWALASVGRGVERIVAAIADHSTAPNAALQMAGALSELMAPWVAPMPHVTGSALLGTTLGRTLLESMRRGPHRCAAAYNTALQATGIGGFSPLLVGEERVELPLWRLADDGRRMRAFDHDVERWLSGEADGPTLMPRALMLTALIRLGLSDLFIHGTGGAAYDRTMERWLERWLAISPSPMSVVSATVRLPLEPDQPPGPGLHAARAAARRAWHDPESLGGPPGRGPGPRKRAWIERIERAPRRSTHRRELFFSLHGELEQLRSARSDALASARRRVDEAAERAAAATIIESRSWPFPLYPPEILDELAGMIRGQLDV
jgi:hypothetical protein